ncbi:hypothetical protein JCM11251_005093 [Rhodosporidiobolus azoricus]
MTSTTTAFDSALASILFPSLVNLAHLAHSSSSSSPSTDSATTAGAADAAASKLELSKQAAHLRSTLSTLKTQAAHTPAGNLSLEDQDWLIGQLEQELTRKRDDLAKMAELTALVTTSGTSPQDMAMDTA